MKKRIPVKWIILTVVLALLLWFVIWLITIIPVYPVFRKHVDSYDDLRQALDDYPEICLPETMTLELNDDEYYIILDERNIFAEPESYEIGGSMGINGVTVHYGFSCDLVSRDLSSPDTEYRNVPLVFERGKLTSESLYYHFSTQFRLGELYYSFGAYYDGSTLSEDEIADLNDVIEPQILELVNQTVDSYLDK